eukprot:sb/3471814/
MTHESDLNKTSSAWLQNPKNFREFLQTFTFRPFPTVRGIGIPNKVVTCHCKVGFFEVVTPLLSRGVVFARDSPHLLSVFAKKPDIIRKSIILGVRKTLVWPNWPRNKGVRAKTRFRRANKNSRGTLGGDNFKKSDFSQKDPPVPWLKNLTIIWVPRSDFTGARYQKSLLRPTFFKRL